MLLLNECIAKLAIKKNKNNNVGRTEFERLTSRSNNNLSWSNLKNNMAPIDNITAVFYTKFRRSNYGFLAIFQRISSKGIVCIEMLSLKYFFVFLEFLYAYLTWIIYPHFHSNPIPPIAIEQGFFLYYLLSVYQCILA